MKNDPLRCFRYAAHNRVISTLAIGSLLFVVSGCDSNTKEIKPTPTENLATNTSIAGNAAFSDKAKVQLTGALPITTNDAENLVQSSDNVDSNVKYISFISNRFPSLFS